MSSRMSAPGISRSKETVILDSCLIITETTEHNATCDHRKMRPDDLFMHHELPL